MSKKTFWGQSNSKRVLLEEMQKFLEKLSTRVIYQRNVKHRKDMRKYTIQTAEEKKRQNNIYF